VQRAMTCVTFKQQVFEMMRPYLGTDAWLLSVVYSLDGWRLSPATGTFAPIRFCARYPQGLVRLRSDS
jgi:hypothetical protein